MFLKWSVSGWLIPADGWLLDSPSYLFLVTADFFIDFLYAIVYIHRTLRIAETHLPLQVAIVLLLLFFLTEIK